MALRRSWSFSGSEGSEIPLESGTGTRRPFLMAALLTGGLVAAVGDVVGHLEGQMFDMSNVHVSLLQNKQDIPCYLGSFRGAGRLTGGFLFILIASC